MIWTEDLLKEGACLRLLSGCSTDTHLESCCLFLGIEGSLNRTSGP